MHQKNGKRPMIVQRSPKRTIKSPVWSYCWTFVLRANSWIWPLLAFLFFVPHPYLIVTLTVRVNRHRERELKSKTFIIVRLSFSVNRFLCAIKYGCVTLVCLASPPKSIEPLRSANEIKHVPTNFQFLSALVSRLPCNGQSVHSPDGF